MSFEQLRKQQPQQQQQKRRQQQPEQEEDGGHQLQQLQRQYTFVIVPKVLDPWYDETFFGCQSRAAEISSEEPDVTIECVNVGYTEAIPSEQARLINELVNEPEKHGLSKPPDGISVAVLDEEITGEAINNANEAGIPIITFDSDAPDSQRRTFVSTDNHAFGYELGKVLNQLFPQGGNFGMITGNGPNLIGRLQGVRDRLLNDELHPTDWKEVDYSPLNCENNVTYANELMHQYASDPDIDAIIPIGGWPMFNDVLWKEFIVTQRENNRDIATVVADSVNIQLELMAQGYVNGLVGQLPFQMGEFSANELYAMNLGRPLTEDPTEVLGTNLLEILRVPLMLPTWNLNENHLGYSSIMGYVLSAALIVACVVIAMWVWMYRTSRCIKVSQPEFLLMTIFGIMIAAASIIPLSMSDDANRSQEVADIACMTFPWLLAIGFSMAFAALFSKTWRLYQIGRAAKQFRRVRISVRDVLWPFFAVLGINIIVLTFWTVFAPLKYLRQSHPGTDDWNRVISTYGTCRSSESSSDIFFGILLTVNGALLIILNVYAYLARNVVTEYSESRYIALANASMLQSALIGFPIVVLVGDTPLIYYVVLALTIFTVCSSILGFIFMPKVIAVNLSKNNKHRRRDGFVLSNHRKQNHAGNNSDIPNVSGEQSAEGVGVGDGGTDYTNTNRDSTGNLAGMKFAVVGSWQELENNLRAGGGAGGAARRFSRKFQSRRSSASKRHGGNNNNKNGQRENDGEKGSGNDDEQLQDRQELKNSAKELLNEMDVSDKEKLRDLFRLISQLTPEDHQSLFSNNDDDGGDDNPATANGFDNTATTSSATTSTGSGPKRAIGASPLPTIPQSTYTESPTASSKRLFPSAATTTIASASDHVGGNGRGSDFHESSSSMRI